jgi:hypothetical protein
MDPDVIWHFSRARTTYREVFTSTIVPPKVFIRLGSYSRQRQARAVRKGGSEYLGEVMDSGPANLDHGFMIQAALLRNIRAAATVISTAANLPILLEVDNGLFTRVSSLTTRWPLPYPL